MLKHKLMRELEDYSKKIDDSQENLFKYRAEKKLLNKEYLKLANKSQTYKERNKEEYSKLKNSFMQKLAELDGKIKEEVEFLENVNEEVNKKFTILFHVLDSFYGSFEFFRMIKNKTGQDWQIQYVKAPEGAIVGVCLVSENDPNWDKQIRANISLSENTVDIKSTKTLKVLFTEVQGSIDYLAENWDWLQFSLFYHTDFYFDDVIGEKYQAFIEENKEFAEFLATEIRNDFYKDDLDELFAEK